MTASPLRHALSIALASALLLGSMAAAAQAAGLRGLAGEQLTDADLAHGTTIAVIWAGWSPRSRDIVPRANALAGRWGGRARVVTVNFQEDRQAVEQFLAGKGLAVPVFLDTDGAFSKQYAVATLPGLLIVKDGQVAYRGKLPDDADRVIEESLR